MRSEALKVTSVRMTWGLIGGALAFTILDVVALVFTAGQRGVPPLTVESSVRNVYAASGQASVLVLVLGIMGMTTEYRFQTVTTTFAITPRRSRVLTAKIAVHALAGMVVGLLCAATAIAIATAILSFKPHAAIPVATVAQIGGATMLAFAFYAAVGVAVGALIRNQIAAVTIALVWVLIVEALLVAFLPAIGKWLPGGALSSVLQATSLTANGASYLPVWGGALLLLCYAAGFFVAATRTTMRRDVT